MSDRPRILFLAPDLPYPIRAGGQMRMAVFVQALARIGNVHIACLARHVPSETIAWCNDLGVSIDYMPRLRITLLRCWMERVRMVATRCNLVDRPEERAFFEEQRRRFQPDLVWLETPYLVRYAVRWRREVPVVVNYWGTSEGAMRDFHLARGLRKLWNWFRWQAALGGERRYAPRLSAIVTVSEKDAAWFRSIAPGTPVRAIPNAVLRKIDPERYAEKEELPGLMVFTGDLAYQPNVDAVLWFTESIFPGIRNGFPSARFRAAGRQPVPEIAAFDEKEGIEVLADVPDLLDVIAEAAVYVLPMRLGSGIRSKLFDVFPLGKAIVTTSVGAEGLDLFDGENCRIADDPADFADACVTLLRNAAERRRLGAAVRKLAAEVYTMERVERDTAELVRSLLAPPSDD